MRCLVDTNIIIDHVKDRGSFGIPARKLMMLGFLHELELWVSSSQITNAYYLLSDGGKPSLSGKVKSSLKGVRAAVRVCSFGESDVDAALDSTWDDFEDACVYQCALRMKADAIITRNKSDFEKSSIKVFDCDELFAYLAEEKGLTYEEIPW